MLKKHCNKLIHDAAMLLDQAEMIRYDPTTGYLHITDMGRTASHYYINYETVSRFSGKLKEGYFYHDAELFDLISHAQEFDQLKVIQKFMS